MQSPSLKANQQTEKLESVLPEFILVSEIQRESKYIVYKSISHLNGNFSTCDKLPKSLTHSCTQISMWRWKSETERIFYPWCFFGDPCTIRELIYGTYLFETHFVFLILARCFCCFWAGLLFTWPDLLGFGARVCTLSSQVLRSKIK